MKQYNINFNINESYTFENFIVSDSNKIAYETLINSRNTINFLFLLGPNKSGKSHIASIWKKKYNAELIYLNNLITDKIIEINNNIVIEDVFKNLHEEKLFYLINHFKNNNLKILLTSNIKPTHFDFNSNDLASRIKSFHLVKITQPDEFLVTNLIIKLFNDRQIIIKNDEVINYIYTHIERSFDNIFSVVDKIDKFSLSNKREITIPMIKKII